jgi:hypothetical protein
MAWQGPSKENPVWCSVNDPKSGKPTAQSVDCQTNEPKGTEVASLNLGSMRLPGMAAQTEGSMAGGSMAAIPLPASYQKFTSQRELGNFLIDKYKIRKPNELSSCEVCHR